MGDQLAQALCQPSMLWNVLTSAIISALIVSNVRWMQRNWYGPESTLCPTCGGSGVRA